jgi:ribonuclease VapC
VNRIVLDASAMLAVLNGEPGCEKLTLQMLSHAAASTVNLAEVHAKLVSRGGDPDEAWEDTLSSVQESMPFTEEHAKVAGSLTNATRALGLSLGDRACLALALTLQVPAYTTDRSWKKLDLGIRIHVIR